MERSSLARIVRGVEYVYAVLALFALTQGPVYQLWSASAGALITSPEPGIPHVYFASFIAVQIPALMLVFRGVRGSFFIKPSNLMLALLLGWLSATVLWSTLARHSLVEVVALVCTATFGIYLVTRFTWSQRWLVIGGAMSLGLGSSLYAIRREWPGASDTTGDYWIGIYFNRNSLAPVAAIALIAALALILVMPRLLRVREVSMIAVSLLLATVAALILVRSKSQTSPAALLVACGCVVAWWVARRVVSRMMLDHHWWSPMTFTLVVVAVVMGFTLWSIGDLPVASGETSTFNSRSALWSMSWSGFELKPWQGWGWLAAWHTPEFFVQGNWWAIWDTTWSHNGYHDLLLGGGVPAALLFGAYVIASARALDRLAIGEASIRLLVAAFVLTASTQESFFIGSHFLWAMLVASFCVVESRELESVEQQHTAEVTPTSS